MVSLGAIFVVPLFFLSLRGFFLEEYQNLFLGGFYVLEKSNGCFAFLRNVQYEKIIDIISIFVLIFLLLVLITPLSI